MIFSENRFPLFGIVLWLLFRSVSSGELGQVEAYADYRLVGRWLVYARHA
jgi:hypothetical protein